MSDEKLTEDQALVTAYTAIVLEMLARLAVFIGGNTLTTKEITVIFAAIKEDLIQPKRHVEFTAEELEAFGPIVDDAIGPYRASMLAVAANKKAKRQENQPKDYV